MRWSSLLAGLFVALFCSMVRADGFLIISDGPPRTDHFAFAPLEVAYHHVDVQIDDMVATTHVDQAFYNPTGRRLEGTYIFPLPAGATVDRFAMDIDGHMTEAELLDATRARATYEEIVRKYRDPALLEYVGRGAMRVRVFPIEPNSTKHIQITYTQALKPDSGVMEYMYPLNTEKFSAKPLKDVSIRVQLKGSQPIKSIYSPTHDLDIRRDGLMAATVGFEAHDVRPDIDFRLMVTRDPKPVSLRMLTYRRGNEPGYFMLLASPGVDERNDSIQAKDICFVLDTSGSMAGPKIEQAKKALQFCLQNLNSGDRFEIVRFSTEAEPLFGSLQSASRENVNRATSFVEQLKPIGGTAIEDALKRVREIRDKADSPSGAARPFMVVFLTDGRPTVGTTQEEPLVKLASSLSHTRVFTFGMGLDVNTALLDRMANETQAISQYVLPTEDIETKVSNFYTKIQSPVLTDVALEVDGSGIALQQVYPSSIPDLYRGDTLLAFGRYTGSGQANVRIVGKQNGSTCAFISSTDFAASDSRYAFIPRLWATRRVGWLLDEIHLHGESTELRDEITLLAREHGIVTPYTAFLILEDERRRAVPPEGRTMRELDSDTRARASAANTFDSASASSGIRADSGAQAVQNSLALNRLKESVNLQQAQQDAGLAKSAPASVGGIAGNAVGGGRGGEGYKFAQNYSQQVRVVNGRAFYQNGTVWTDNTVQAKKELKRQEIAFNSPEYFGLLAQYPDAIPWFSLGNELDVVLDDTLYVVR